MSSLLVRLQRCNLKSVMRLNSILTNKYSKTTTELPEEPELMQKELNENEKQYYEAIKGNYLGFKAQRSNETLDEKRARLVYQSRKRGTSENGILLTTFSNKYLANMNENQLDDYDKIVNNLYNEWDLYYWMTNAKPIPEELANNPVMVQLKEYCLNKERENRLF